MRRLVRPNRPLRFALLPMAVAAALAPALPAQAAAAWLCSLSDDAVRLVCVADADPRDEPMPGPVGTATPATGAVNGTASVNGTRFPLDPRRLYTVDLWSPPTEPEWVALLARSTICYRSPGCTVTMAPYGGFGLATARARTDPSR